MKSEKFFVTALIWVNTAIFIFFVLSSQVEAPTFETQACTEDASCDSECGGSPSYRNFGTCFSDSSCFTECSGSSSSSSGGAGNSTQCGSVSNSITLIQDVSAENTCYTFGANNIVLDCDGYNITYATSAMGGGSNGISVPGYGNFTIKNCEIAEGKNTSSLNIGISLAATNNGTVPVQNFSIKNTNVTTNTNGSHGLSMTGPVDNFNISDLSVFTKGANASGVFMEGLHNESGTDIRNSTFNTTGTNSIAVYMNGSNYSFIFNSTLLTTGEDADTLTLLESLENTFLNLNISSTYGKTINDTTPVGYVNHLIFNNSFGELKWINKGVGAFNKDLSLSAPIALGKDVVIGANTIALNTSSYNLATDDINKSANITLKSLNFTALNDIFELQNFETDSGQIRKNGTQCLPSGNGKCVKIAYTSNILYFNITSFSSYSGNGTEAGGGTADLTINSLNITFNDSGSTYIGNHPITLRGNVSNQGSADATNVKVQFLQRTGAATFAEINNATINVTAGSITEANVTFTPTLGPNNVTVKIDPDNSISESDENNNNNSRILDVSAYQTYHGSAQARRKLGQNTTTLREWVLVNASVIMAADIDSNPTFAELQEIGLNTTNGSSNTDFTQLDATFGMTGFDDSITTLYSTNGSSPNSTENFVIVGQTHAATPIISSSPGSTFITGILWDTSDDTGDDGEFDLSDREDLVFVTRWNGSQSTEYGVKDYVLKVPANLQGYIGETDQLAIYAALP